MCFLTGVKKLKVESPVAQQDGGDGCCATHLVPGAAFQILSLQHSEEFTGERKLIPTVACRSVEQCVTHV